MQVTLHGLAFRQFRLVLLSNDILSSSVQAKTFHKVTALIRMCAENPRRMYGSKLFAYDIKTLGKGIAPS